MLSVDVLIFGVSLKVPWHSSGWYNGHGGHGIVMGQCICIVCVFDTSQGRERVIWPGNVAGRCPGNLGQLGHRWTSVQCVQGCAQGHEHAVWLVGVAPGL